MTENPRRSMVERATELSDELLDSVEIGRHAVIEAVRRFVSAVEEVVPPLVYPSLRKRIVDAAVDLADELASVRMEFLRSIVHSAGHTLGSPDGEKQ